MSFVSELNKERNEIAESRNNHTQEKLWISDAIWHIKNRVTSINRECRDTVLEGYFSRADGDLYIHECDEATAMSGKYGEHSGLRQLTSRIGYAEDTAFIVNELHAQLSQLGFKNIRIRIYTPDLLGIDIKERWTLFGNKKVTKNTYVKSHGYYKILYFRIEW